ncbi:MAG: hypothetical protein U0R71_11840 [Solirubrobacterales bacterium]
MRLKRITVALTAALCALVLLGAVGSAQAEGLEPVTGGWKGKTAQGFAISFGVLPIYSTARDGTVLFNFRLTLRNVVCGTASVNRRNVALSVDPAGGFAGTIGPNGLQIEGSFTGSRQAEGRIVLPETSGVPGCTRQVVAFSAHAKR